MLAGRCLVTDFRDVTLKQVEEAKGKLSDVVFRRCRHVVTEIERCTRFAKHLTTQQYEQAGALMIESHNSLRDDYEVSVPAVDRLVELASAQPGVFGARMTGGGFGGAIVALAAAGADIVAVGRTPPVETQSAVEAMGRGFHAISADLSSMEPIGKIVAQSVERFGGIDILVNNAGRSIRRPLEESLDRWHDVERTITLNYYAPLRLIGRLAPGMVERGERNISLSNIGVFAKAFEMTVSELLRFDGEQTADAYRTKAER